jgi:hypothetical protein
MKSINCLKQNQYTEEVQLFIKRNSCHITQDTLTSNRTVDNVQAVWQDPIHETSQLLELFDNILITFN